MHIEQSRNPDFDQLPDAAHVREPVVLMLVGGPSRSTVWRWVKTGKFPAPHKIGPGVTAWNVGELRRHFAESKAA